MHELSIAVELVAQAEAAARNHPGRVVAVVVRVGPLAGVVPEALRFAFELAREQTPLADAELLVEEVPLVAYCPQCDCERTLATPMPLRCPACGSTTPKVVIGRELEIASLEMEP
jgi:hydrogenase nickel incorporation protein HypA/HybF